MPTDAPQFPLRVPFDKPDGKDVFNKLDHMFYAKQRGYVDQGKLATIPFGRLIELFGPGEARPIEHTDGRLVWRFLHEGIHYRVVASPAATKPSNIFVEERSMPAKFEDVAVDIQKVTKFVAQFLDYVQRTSAPIQPQESSLRQ